MRRTKRNKEWRIVQLSPLITFGDKPRWIVSKRKLTDAELSSIQLTHFRYDFQNELGISGDGCLIMGCVTLPGATKSEAEAECLRLNNGKKLFEEFFTEDEDV